MKYRLDPNSPIPLYHQIAEAVRWSISTGRLARGARLPPVRLAAEQFDVNRHTVRRAYRDLAEEGLVETRGAGGTVVLGSTAAVQKEGPGREQGLSEIRFLDQVLREARQRFGLDRDALVQRLAGRDPAAAAAPEVIYVLECSDSQCRDHAAEIASHWQVDARPWCLANDGEPPGGVLVATFFHYPEIQRRWPHRRSDVHFVPIHPDPTLPDRVAPALERSGATRLVTCELDETKALNLRADLSVLFPESRFQLETRVADLPDAAWARADDPTPVLFSPRAWAALDTTDREDPRAIKTRYVIEDEALSALGKSLGWPRLGPFSRRPDQ